MHTFKGKWISDAALSGLSPRNVFHRQLDAVELDCTENRNQHILFRRSFTLGKTPSKSEIYITADDYYKLYINGKFVSQGPAPSYHFQYNYNKIDVTEYLTKGENLIAVHTLYQGLINRVWQSADQRHGLILDLVCDGETVIASDESFCVATHTAYTETGICGYDTQFLERYDSRAREVGFESVSFDDSYWSAASVCINDDHTLAEQRSGMLVFEEIAPVSVRARENRIVCDFGANYVGYLSLTARGACGDTLTIRCAQELDERGEPRYELRANCKYEEEWVLADGECTLDWFDYKSFRYAEIILPEGVETGKIALIARHYPFTLSAKIKPEYESDADIRRIWDLCVHTQKYGVQEVIQDCMEREKGFYLGDGCYTALTHAVLTGDDAMLRKLIDDAFASSFITDTLVTCMDCSFMQEIAEYPLILVYSVLWHYKLTRDLEYLRENYAKVTSLLDAYRRDYERGGLLCELDKWCVVEWPSNFRDGYDVDLTERQVCHDAHVSINAYYLKAIITANEIASILGLEEYRSSKEVSDAFYGAFYDDATGLFRDGVNTEHISIIGCGFAYGLGLCPSERSKRAFLDMLDTRGVSTLSLFCTFPVLMGLARDGEWARITEALLCEGAWLRMLREDATTTFEGWGKDTKWNTSLFHLTMSYAALFIADTDLKDILN